MTLVLFAFGVAVVFGAKPLYRELKARRALTIAEQAGAALDQGQGADASTLLRQAAVMAFDDERVMARITYHAARAGDTASVVAIGKKLDEGKASPEEILVFGERSLGAGGAAEAERALAALPPDLPPAEAARRIALRAGLLQAQKNPAEAERVMRGGLSTLPPTETSRLRLMLASLLLGAEGAPGRDEAQKILEETSLESSEDGASALRLLAMSRAGISPEAQAALAETTERLRQHPASSAADEVFIARLVISSDQSRQADAIKTLVAKLKERGAGLDDRVGAARWLIGLQANEEVLELINPEDPLAHAGALMARIDALSGLNRWDECHQLLEATRGGALPDTLYYLFRGRMAEAREDKAAAETEKRQLRQAMQFAEMPHVLFAARYAESVGWKPEAFAAWRILATDSGAQVEALRGQLRNLAGTASATEGAELAGALLALQPQDPSARLSAAYFRLLAGQQLDESAATAEELLAADPTSIDVRRVAALARLRKDDAAGGLEIFPEDNGEARWQAVQAALLQATGKTTAAEKVNRAINRDELTPEEQALLRGIAQ
ncbi:MAG: hypothetical protein ACOYOL_05875 [Chthoniobacterales bacterium]